MAPHKKKGKKRGEGRQNEARPVWMSNLSLNKQVHISSFSFRKRKKERRNDKGIYQSVLFFPLKKMEKEGVKKSRDAGKENLSPRKTKKREGRKDRVI